MKISPMVVNALSRHEYMVEMAIFNVQRAITPKVGNQELCFMSSALLYIHVKFHENISKTVFNSQSGHKYMVEMAIFYVQRGNNSHSRKPALWFICSAHPLIMLHETISNGFQLTEWAQVHGRNPDIQCSKGSSSRARKPKVMVHVFCMLSHNEVS